MILSKIRLVEKSKFIMGSIKYPQYNGTHNVFVANLMDSLIPLTISALTSNIKENRHGYYKEYTVGSCGEVMRELTGLQSRRLILSVSTGLTCNPEEEGRQMKLKQELLGWLY